MKIFANNFTEKDNNFLNDNKEKYYSPMFRL